MNLNERIGQILAESEFTSSEFADEIDVQRSSISHITSGRNKPSLEFITKIKYRFPEISWDWLINGEGEMKPTPQILQVDDNEVRKTENKTVAPPDLFSLIDDDQFGITEREDKIENGSARESFKPITESLTEKISDSQRLEKPDNKILPQNVDSQEIKIKKIVMFYSNGKFESFEP